MDAPRILVIDDSPSTSLFIADALQQNGYRVEIALNGRDGLAKLMSFQPHCLVLDVLLPDINGYAFCRYLRQSIPRQRLPLILISAKSAPLDISYGLRQGADRYIPKPFTADVLIQNICDVVPGAFRTITQTSLPVPPPLQEAPAALLKLIPRRNLSQDAMQTSNPFERKAPAVEDKQANLLFSRIDDKKTVAGLATATGLSNKEVIKALRILLGANCILMYDAEGRCVEEKS